MGFSCLQCFRRFSQIVLLIINVIVAILGLAVMSLGAWAKASGRHYFEIAGGDSQFTQVPVLLIILGIFVALVGIVGAVGALFASTIFGRIVLGLYAVILTLLVICEIAGGIAAGVLRNDVDSLLRESINTTFMNYNSTTDASIRDSWDTFQKSSMCCGVESPADYHYFFNNNTVPASCCSKNLKTQQCEETRQDYTASDEIYQLGCATRVSKDIKANLGAIAAGAIVIGLIQIAGIVMSCFVAIAKKENKYEVV